MRKSTIQLGSKQYTFYEVHTLVVGSGAASLACADILSSYKCTDLAIVTSKLGGGTSFNSGSDKQTYYKLALEGSIPDSPMDMAHSLYDGGSMHGDIALIEATASPQAFFRLVSAGVPFPHNYLGAFCGYKTDHDPRRRATSAGPWTSRQMGKALLAKVQRHAVPILDGHDAVSIIVSGGRAAGLVTIDTNGCDDRTHGLTLFKAENLVLGAGGPGGLYKQAVYPPDQLGAIGIAFEAGAEAVNLTESQYGLASIAFRWNVSGTYQQVIPRYFSTNADGGDQKEFLCDVFPTMGRMASAVFLKGYQWPFDPRKIAGYQSSLIDIAVYYETQIRGRRVFMDFTRNPVAANGFSPFAFEDLEPEAFRYLENSEALFGTPIQRLVHMNPMAIELYQGQGIDITREPLEIAVCAQHNNGGLAGDIWWESNIRHLFPVGEINGTHGVYRPGGSALNSGQVGALRAAQRIAHVYADSTITAEAYQRAAYRAVQRLEDRILKLFEKKNRGVNPVAYREEFQQRMSDYGAHIRSGRRVARALADAYRQIEQFNEVQIVSTKELPYALANYHLCLAHAAYLAAIDSYLQSGGGSRGSYVAICSEGESVAEMIDPGWRHALDEGGSAETLRYTRLQADGRFASECRPRRPIPDRAFWFEKVWNDFVTKDIFHAR